MIRAAMEKKHLLMQSLQYSQSLDDKGEKIRSSISECEKTIIWLLESYEWTEED